MDENKYKGVNLDTFEGYPKNVRPLFTTPFKDGMRHRLREYIAISKLMMLDGKPFQILTWQAATLAFMTQMDDNGVLIYKDIGLSVTRQQGKSTLLALIILHHMLTRRGAVVVSIGGTVVTSKVSFNILRNIILESPALLEHFTPGKQEIFCKLTNSKFIYRAPNRSTLGESISLVLADERLLLADRHGDAALAAIRNSQVAVHEPLFISTSTVGDNRSWETQWGAEWRRGRKLSKNPNAYWDEEENQRFAFIHYGVPDDECLDDPESWVMAMPAIVDGIGSLADAKADYRQHDEGGMIQDFMMYRLGLWAQGIDGSNAAFNMDEWYEMHVPVPVEFKDGARVMLGLDASTRHDHTVLIARGLDSDEDGRYPVKTLWSWKPVDEFDSMPMDELVDAIRNALTTYDAWLAFDPALIGEDLTRMERREFRGRMTRIPQSVPRMAPAASLVMQNAKQKKYIIGEDDPINYYAANATLKSNGMLTKASRDSKEKVDGIVALAMAEYDILQKGDKLNKAVRGKTQIKVG